MENVHYATYGWVAVITAIICGKWALELGFGQVRQLLWALAGLALPPVVLLVLYVRLIRQQPQTRSALGRLA